MEKGPRPVKHPASEKTTKPEWRLIVLSAAAEGAVKAQMKNLGVLLEQRPEAFEVSLMPNLAYTLGQRRSILKWKIAIPAPSSTELMEKLSAKNVKPVRSTEEPNIGFVFTGMFTVIKSFCLFLLNIRTGQGAQTHQMGLELMESHPIFAHTVKAADQCLQGLGASFSLLEELAKDKADTLVDTAQISQPACTAIQIALVDLLQSWRVSPTAVTGHSSGEIGKYIFQDLIN